MNIAKKIPIFLLFFACLCTLFVPCAAQENIPAYVFYFSNLGIGGSESIYADLLAMGYDAELDDDRDAREIVDDMGKAGVFVYIGHGSPGILACAGDTVITALETDNGENYVSLEAKYANTAEKLSNVRLVYYGSCFSNSYSTEFGRLTTYTADVLEAGSVVGFDNSVSDRVTTRFETVFFNRLLAEYSVQTAINLAKADAQASFPSSYEASNVGTAIIFGDGNIRINPAGFRSN